MKPDYLNLPGFAAPVGFSHVTVARPGRLVHVSGQVSKDATGRTIGTGDLSLQTEQAYANLQAALETAGATLNDVIKVVTYVVDLTAEKTELVRAVRNRLLRDSPYPASTIVGVASLIEPELLIEIEAVAAMD